MPAWEISAQNPLSTLVKGPGSLRVSETGISSNSNVTSVNQIFPGLFLDTEIKLHRRVPSGTTELSESPREVGTLPDSCLAIVWPGLTPKQDTEPLTSVIPTQISLR